MSDPVPSRSRSEVFADWHREESFWRDVYTRAFAGVITAVVAGALAIAFGLIKVARYQVISVSFVLGLPLLTLALWLHYNKKYRGTTGVTKFFARDMLIMSAPALVWACTLIWLTLRKGGS